MNKKIRILLADDTLIAREGWKKILETVRDIEIVGEVTTAHQVPIAVRKLVPDVLLMDLMWLGDETAGAAAIAQIKRETPQTKVIAITAYHHLVANARKVGADGALPKGFSKSELVDTIRAVCELGDFSLKVDEAESSNELSDREKEILNLMAGGLTDKEIANKLNIAESTAKNHASNILVKLDATNRTHAVSIGYQKGILK